MIVMSQIGTKIRIGKEHVLRAYTTVSSQIPSFPTFPTGGYDAEGLYGKWYAYNDLSDCMAFKQACNSIITFQHESMEVKLKVEVVNLTALENHDPSYRASNKREARNEILINYEPFFRRF
jgi:hypothetical protein